MAALQFTSAPEPEKSALRFVWEPLFPHDAPADYEDGRLYFQRRNVYRDPWDVPDQIGVVTLETVRRLALATGCPTEREL